MDIWGAVIVPGVIAAIISLGTSWYFARRSEIRTGKRDHELRALYDTKKHLEISVDYLVRRRARGDTGSMLDHTPISETPLADADLVGDQALLDRLAMWIVRVGHVSDGNVLTNAERGEIGAIQADLEQVLDGQIGRAIAYKPLAPKADWKGAERKARAWLDANPDNRRRMGWFEA